MLFVMHIMVSNLQCNKNPRFIIVYGAWTKLTNVKRCPKYSIIYSDRDFRNISSLFQKIVIKEYFLNFRVIQSSWRNSLSAVLLLKINI